MDLLTNSPDVVYHDPTQSACRDEGLFVGKVDEEYICPVGHGVLRDPVMTLCQHEFCRSCLQKALQHREECPLCRNTLKESDLKPAYKTSRQIQKLTSYCCNKINSCDWEGSWSDLDSHKEQCPYQLLVCEFCNEPIQRRLAADHLESCVMRPEMCLSCQEEYPTCDMNTHVASCPKKMISCDLCDKKMFLESKDNHDSNHCQLAITSCPFKEYGCPVGDVKRQDLDQHITSFISSHTLLLCAKISDQDKKILQQQMLIEKLLQRTSVLTVEQVSDNTGPCNFSSITEALLNAEPGDHVVVKSGVYRECLMLDRGITLQADGANVVIENVKESNVVIVSGPGTLAGFKLRQKSPNFFCIRVTSTDSQTTITRCDIESQFSCLQIESHANPIVRHNKIHSASQCGILVKKAGKGIIQHNDIFNNCLVNIYVDELAEPCITENRIYSSQQHGVWIKPNVGPAAVVSENIIYNNAMSDVKLEDGANPKMTKNSYRSGEG